MTFARIEPWALLDRVSRDVGDRQPAGSARSPGTDWTPAADILEEEDRFVLRIDVPGVEPADIDVSMDNDILSITGQRSAADSDNAARRRVERLTGRFARHFRLADGVDADGIAARCSNGILEVVIPKATEVPARRITVRAA